MLIEIRYAKPDDAEKIAELYEGLVNHHVGLNAYSKDDIIPNIREQIIGYYQNDVVPNKNAIVACDNGRIVGFCEFETLSDELVRKDRDMLFITDLYVEPLYQKKGIGSMLITKAEEIKAERGLKRLELLADLNNKQALEFYTKNGFRMAMVILVK